MDHHFSFYDIVAIALSSAFLIICHSKILKYFVAMLPGSGEVASQRQFLRNAQRSIMQFNAVIISQKSHQLSSFMNFLGTFAISDSTSRCDESFGE